MALTRRGFIGAILATACAPAIVRADALMRIVPRETQLLTVFEWAERYGTGADLHAEWMAAVLRAVADGGGVTYGKLARDFQLADYRAGRAG